MVDCGSAHGTFINGVRVRNVSASSNIILAAVMPHRIRRGALIRFGGPGAPCYILKSFAVGFESLVKDFGVSANEILETPPLIPIDALVTKKLQMFVPSPISKYTPNILSNPSQDISYTVSPENVAALVQINTRLNAIGGARNLTASSRKLARRASAQLGSSLQVKRSHNFYHHLIVKRAKKCRVISNAACADAPTSLMSSNPPALISPVSTSKRSILSTEILPPHLLLSGTPLRLKEVLTIPSGKTLSNIEVMCQSDVGDMLKRNYNRKVQFSEFPQIYYPNSVTPDELSADEDDLSLNHVVFPPTTPRPTNNG